MPGRAADRRPALRGRSSVESDDAIGAAEPLRRRDRAGCRAPSRRRAARRPAPRPRRHAGDHGEIVSASSESDSARRAACARAHRASGSTAAGASRRSIRSKRIGKLRRELGAVRDDDEDRVLLRRCRSSSSDATVVGRCAIEVAGRLVAQQQPRLPDQRARDRDPLPLAARQFGRPVIDAIGEADLLDQRPRAAASASPADVGARPSVGTSTFSSTVHCGSRQ